MSKKVFLLSGGVDSAFCACSMRVNPGDVGLFVDYGQPASFQEEKAAKRIADWCGLEFEVVRVLGVCLGDMEFGVAAHVVPARNLFLIGLAANHGDEIIIGAAPQDRGNYPDCREPFLSRVNEVLNLAYGKSVIWSTSGREQRLKKLGSLAELCWSCYQGGETPCGDCPSCLQ